MLLKGSSKSSEILQHPGVTIHDLLTECQVAAVRGCLKTDPAPTPGHFEEDLTFFVEGKAPQEILSASRLRHSSDQKQYLTVGAPAVLRDVPILRNVDLSFRSCLYIHNAHLPWQSAFAGQCDMLPVL